MAKTFMRIDKAVLAELKENKENYHDSCSQVVKRLLQEKKAKKDLLTTEKVKRILNAQGYM